MKQRCCAWAGLVVVLIVLAGCGGKTERVLHDAADDVADRVSPEARQVDAPDAPIALSPADPEGALSYAADRAAEMGLARHTFSKRVMGTSAVIMVYTDDAELAQRASDAAFAEMVRLESVMSDYPQSYPDSELLMLAQAAHDAPGQPQQVSDDLWPVLLRSKQVYDATGGAFDITARPYTGLWRISRERGVLPPAEALAEHALLVGMHHLILDEQAQTAYLDAPGAWLDLGGIAKGYIADRALDVLRDHGIAIAQVRAGGDMSFGDAPPGLEGWPVNVPDFPPPEVAAGEMHERGNRALDSGGGLSFWHANGGASVSGDAFRFVEIEGVRYSHVVDPRSGLGVTGSRYCCVRGPSAFASDAAATAGCVMDGAGFEEALKKLEQIEGPLTGWRFQGSATDPAQTP